MAESLLIVISPLYFYKNRILSPDFKPRCFLISIGMVICPFADILAKFIITTFLILRFKVLFIYNYVSGDEKSKPGWAFLRNACHLERVKSIPMRNLLFQMSNDKFDFNVT